MRRRSASGGRGFTLIEVALSVAIAALLFGALAPTLAAMLERRQYRDEARSLERVRLALSGFAQSEGRLPCPDHDGDGLEEPDCSSSGASGRPSTRGGLPFAELGLPPGDRWGRAYTYAVSEAFTRAAVPGAGCGAQSLDLCDDGTLTVRARGDDPGTPGVIERKALITLATRVPAVVVSHGRDGAAAPAAAGSDQTENADGDGVFVDRARTGAATSGCSDVDDTAAFCRFDDVVLWLSARVLLHRLVVAGRLP